MRYEITGDNLEVVTIHLDGGEMVYAEAGAMNHMIPLSHRIHTIRQQQLCGIRRKRSR